MDFDVIVVGAGAGGLMTAARLARLGPDNLPPDYTEAVKRADRP